MKLLTKLIFLFSFIIPVSIVSAETHDDATMEVIEHSSADHFENKIELPELYHSDNHDENHEQNHDDKDDDKDDSHDEQHDEMEDSRDDNDDDKDDSNEDKNESTEDKDDMKGHN